MSLKGRKAPLIPLADNEQQFPCSHQGGPAKPSNKASSPQRLRVRMPRFEIPYRASTFSARHAKPAVAEPRQPISIRTDTHLRIGLCQRNVAPGNTMCSSGPYNSARPWSCRRQ